MKFERHEYGHAGHFICAYDCLFRRTTFVGNEKGGVIISTIGDYRPTHVQDRFKKMATLGAAPDSFFETYIALAEKRSGYEPGWGCCAWEAQYLSGAVVVRYATAEGAQTGHEYFVNDALSQKSLKKLLEWGHRG